MKKGDMCIVVESGTHEYPEVINTQLRGRVVTLDFIDQRTETTKYWAMNPDLVIYNPVPGLTTATGAVIPEGSFVATIAEQCLRLIKDRDLQEDVIEIIREVAEA